MQFNKKSWTQIFEYSDRQTDTKVKHKCSTFPNSVWNPKNKNSHVCKAQMPDNKC